jgi:hypothetical protein
MTGTSSDPAKSAPYPWCRALSTGISAANAFVNS